MTARLLPRDAAAPSARPWFASTYRRNDSAASAVVGAILVTAIVFAALVFFRLSVVPVWEQQVEADHMGLVERELATLKSEVDRQVDNRTTVPVSHPLALRAQSANVFVSNRPSHQVGFAADEKTFELAASRLLVQRENGTSYLGLNEQWSEVVGNVSVPAVSELQHLRLRLGSVSQANDGDALALTLLDATGAYAGDLRLLVVAQPIGFDIMARARNATGEILLEQPLAASLQGTRSPYWIDLLSPELRLAELLASVGGPVELRLEAQVVDSGPGNADLVTEYAIAYLQRGATGAVSVGGTGLVREAWSAGYDGGTLTYTGRNLRYVDQTLLLENGALILSQGEAAVLKSAPFFRANLVGSVTTLTLSVPTLVGDDTFVSGTTTAKLATQAARQSQLEAAAPDLTLTVASAHPALWATLWREELDAVAGFSEGLHFVVNETATSASLTVYGLDTAPGSTVNDLYLILRQADVRVEVEA